MSLPTLTSLLLLLSFSPASAQEKRPSSAGQLLARPEGFGSREQLTQIERRRFDAMVRKDTAALEEILSDDLTYIHSTGRLEKKSDFLSSLRSEALVYLSIAPEDLQVRLYVNVES